MNYSEASIFFGYTTGVYCPSNIVAGDTTKFQVGFDTYAPADGWACTFHLKGEGALSVAGTANGTSWDFTLATSRTGTLVPGTYSYAYVMTKNGEQYTVKAGRVDVKPNIAAAIAGDTVTHAQRMVTAIQAAIEGKVTDDVQSLSYYGKTLDTIPADVLVVLLAKYQYAVYRERNTSQVFGKSLATIHLPGY